jgi:lipopolysaccharide transport system permease protein
MPNSPTSAASARIASYRADQVDSVIAHLNPLLLCGDLWKYRNLIRQFTVREIQGRYKGSYLGVIWAMINPLLMLAVYTFVFHDINGQRWDPNNQNENFLVYATHMFIRIIAFNLFSESVNRAPTLITTNINYVKKVIFPLEILPVSLVGSAIFHSALSLLVLLIGAIFGAGTLHWTILFLPLVYVPLVLFSLGLAWLLASLGVFLRDIGNVISVLVQLLFFVTPIFYSINHVPPLVRPIMRYNPLAMIVDNFGRVVTDGLSPDWSELGLITVISAVVAVCGYAWFMKIKRAFADVI